MFALQLHGNALAPRERQTQTDGQRETERRRQTEIDGERHTDRHRETKREGGGGSDRQTDRKKEEEKKTCTFFSAESEYEVLILRTKKHVYNIHYLQSTIQARLSWFCYLHYFVWP